MEIQSLELVSVDDMGDYNLHERVPIMTGNILEEMLQDIGGMPLHQHCKVKMMTNILMHVSHPLPIKTLCSVYHNEQLISTPPWPHGLSI